LSILSEKEITVVFANIEDILLANTGFVSSLEDRQKECRLYIVELATVYQIWGVYYTVFILF